MKRFAPLITIATLLAFATVAFAIQGRQPKAGDGVTIQNATALSPLPAKSRCDTVTGGTLKNYSASGYTQAEWKAITPQGVALPVKRFLNTNTAYMPGSEGKITNDKPLTGAWTVTKFGLQTFTNRTGVYCVDRQ